MRRWPRSGSFSAPPGTEIIYKIYAESFRGRQHLETIVREAETIMNGALEDDATVAALSRALAQLAREIAVAIVTNTRSR
jgi:hypothetical protein